MAQSVAAVEAKKNEDPGFATSWWANVKPNGALVEKQLPKDTYFAKGHDGQWLVVVPSEKLVVARLGFTPTEVDERVASMTSVLIDALH